MTEHTQQDKGAALRAVIFDAAVLAIALEELDHHGHPRNDVGRGENQLAVEAALIKFRSLYDFLFPPANKRKDDLTVFNLGCTQPKNGVPDGDNFRESIHKYSAHLTWTRISEQPEDAVPIFLQRTESLRVPCEIVLAATWDVIREAISKGYQLNFWGDKYFQTLEKQMNSRVICFPNRVDDGVPHVFR